MALLSHFLNKKENPQPEPQNRKQAFFRDFRDIVYILVIFLVVYLLLFRVVIVDGDSMNQTLVHGDRILVVSRTLYHTPKQGDIVVASKDSFRNGECIVKRVIATQGQTVDIDFENRIVYVDGEALDEAYVFFEAEDHGPMIREGMSFPLVVEDGCVFVMGDNRNNSKDSRSLEIGLIDVREILGKAVLLVFPGDDDGRISADYSRIGGFD